MQGVQAKAIELLIENGVSKFPIEPQSLKLPGKSVLFSSYESLPGLMESLKSKQKDIDFCAGLTIETKKGPMILFSGNAGSIERRETITHELAHYLCGHGLYAANTDAAPAGKIQQMQQHKEAEEFKCALLAPSAVLYQMGVDSIEEIQAVAGVSEECAERVMVEMQRRRARRDPFYSYQERRLCGQFQETIELYRAEKFKHKKSASKNRPVFYSLLAAFLAAVIIFLLFLGSFSLSEKNENPQNTQSAPYDSRIVYVTKNGDKYHRDGCVSIKGHEKMAINIDEALKNGYQPCAVCLPDD
ncbi:MAG: ImmA/IrrE family metallo-endopeptidase [Christensenellaceae bacterium]|jgi:hypothetical membrane spanning protein|nr:ImmA/IrrE family metallo-endopeptidase [Christensenellaceae bacterium]MBS6564144.1 ImmA/IrrE family metallo-endopeptidase [Clostridiales bacterium]PWM00918.1 MAG: hypothetical protein DBY09_01200 [Selenomonadales bacterium]